MKNFKKYLMREEVEVAPYVKSGSIDIDDPSVRDNINTLLHGITGRCFITPYIALERVAKVLNNFHIHVPKTTFLENDSGMVSFNISQFGNKFGMQNNGEVVVKNTSPFHLYFEYRMNEKGLFDVFCEILDETELEEIMSDLHDELNDSTDDDDETEEIETASDMRDRSLHEAAKDDTMKGMAAGLAAMAMGATGAVGPSIGNKLMPANIDKWERTHNELKIKEPEKAAKLRTLIDRYKEDESPYIRLSLEKQFSKYFPKNDSLKEAKEAAMAVLSEGKKEDKAADAKAALMRAMERGAPDEEIAALTKRFKKVSGIESEIASKAHAYNKMLNRLAQGKEMDAMANAPSSKSVNESVKKSSK